MNSSKNIRQLRKVGASYNMSLPRELTEPLAMYGGTLVAVESIGPLIVVFPIRDVQDLAGEFRAAFEKAISAFVARKGKAGGAPLDAQGMDPETSRKGKATP